VLDPPNVNAVLTRAVTLSQQPKRRRRKRRACQNQITARPSARHLRAPLAQGAGPLAFVDEHGNLKGVGAIRLLMSIPALTQMRSLMNLKSSIQASDDASTDAFPTTICPTIPHQNGALETLQITAWYAQS
jgi:hypothetical protein